MPRPSVDVIVPFAGSGPALSELLERLSELSLDAGDTLTCVDDRRVWTPPARAVPGGVRLLRSPHRRGSYAARNHGARGGGGTWLLFLDADVEAPPDLLDRYFDGAVDDRVGILAGAIVDEVPPAGASMASRFVWLTRSMGHGTTLDRGRWSFVPTANCAVRRAAFEEVDGFVEGIRSAGDADLCFRLAATDWAMQVRADARVVHRNRRTVRALMAQLVRHGAGAAWLSRRHPGCMPRRRWPGLAWWSFRRLGVGLRSLADGAHDEALVALLEAPTVWAFELGRLLPNHIGPPDPGIQR